MNKYCILITLSLISTFSSAQTDCGPYKVSMVQTQTNDLLVLLRSQNGKESWKFIGLCLRHQQNLTWVY
ncbi:hypothetical protein F907_01115 [Acinetobacter colistiniresistens]|uniref:Secreted protein n=1 Tax=Acinetobacter colistiniresistens TaxID=280145 RepID=S3TS85_9GAMM|nr:hypothetical protein F907_01115 [Acinetobacter colistiniresistens]